jgi:hypothetical protein
VRLIVSRFAFVAFTRARNIADKETSFASTRRAWPSARCCDAHPNARSGASLNLRARRA